MYFQIIFLIFFRNWEKKNIQEMSFDLFAYRELKDVVYDCEDRYHQLERMMEHWDEQERERFQRKQSEDFLGQTEGFLAVLEDRLMDFRSVEFRGMKLSEQEMIQLFYFKISGYSSAGPNGRGDGVFC